MTPTIKDIAARLNLAPSTISRALNNHPSISERVKLEVAAVAAALGYIPHTGAQMMHKHHSNLIGLVLPEITNQVLAVVAKVLAERCARAGYQLVLAVSEYDETLEYRHVKALRAARSAGLIISACASSNPRTVALLSNIPVVQISLRNPSVQADAVLFDDFGGLQSATGHLLDLGHRRIAFIGGPGDLENETRRREGYEAALKGAGIPLDNSIIHQVSPHPEFGRAAVLRLLQDPMPPTAIVAAHSSLTLGIVEALHELGIHPPERLSLVGHGDLEWFKLWGAGITTVAHPVQAFADKAAESLLQQVNAGARSAECGSPPASYLFESTLIVRGTTAPPASH
jgi:LacI family transcriptional regulator